MPPPVSKLALILLGMGLGLAGCVSPGPARRCEAVQFFSPSANVPPARPLSQFVAEPEGGDDCVDACFWTCIQEWQQLAAEPGSRDGANCGSYNSAVWRLLEAACRQGRIDPVRGLTVRCGQNMFTVPVEYCGFSYQPSDFQRLRLPPEGSEPLLQRRYHCCGLGCPLVVERDRRNCDPVELRFHPEKSFFAATVVLEFGQIPAGSDPAAFPASAELKFYNPLQVRHPKSGSQPLAHDLSAPLAVTLEAAPRTYFAGFIEPDGAATQPRLNMLEPYQRGKIPLVLIHGLFSDPQSWADLINDLRASPGFANRYQIWVFRYPTGRGFLQSATALRKELRALVAALDAGQKIPDPALRHLVLIGHSMGGLIAKLLSYSPAARQSYGKVLSQTTPWNGCSRMVLCSGSTWNRNVFLLGVHG